MLSISTLYFQIVQELSLKINHLKQVSFLLSKMQEKKHNQIQERQKDAKGSLIKRKQKLKQ